MNQVRGGVFNSKKKIINAILGVLCAAALFCGFFAVKNTQTSETAEALTSSTINSATKIGDGADLWDSTNNKFNQAVSSDLSLKLFDNGDAVDYIKANANAQEKTWTKSTVVPASVINAKVGNTTYGAVIKLGGLDWMIASLTLGGYDSTTKTEGKIPVLTLYLADNLTNSSNQVVTTPFRARSGTGVSVYSSSPLRKNILSGTGAYSKLALFTNTAADSFATKYLVQPKSIAYQHTETMVNRQSSWNNHPNDALDNLTTGWYSSWSYSPETVYDGTATGGYKARYDAWGDDYIWLPSASEVGFANYAATTCIWKLTNQQRSRTANAYTWLRSGDKSSYPDAGTSLDGSNNWYDNWCSDSNCVRPAIHLNLTEVLGLLEPVDTTKTYNGEAQDLADQAWYNGKVFNDKSLATVKYTRGGNEVVPKDAGEYTVTVTLKDGVDYYWAGDRSKRTRTAKFTIEPKELELEFEVDTEGDGYPHATFVEGKEPCVDDEVEVKLTYVDEKTGETLPGEPMHSGWYTYTASIDEQNYVLIGEVTARFELLARRVDLPAWYNGKSEDVYAGGEDLMFMLVFDPTVFKLSVPEKFQKSIDEGGILLDEPFNTITVSQAGEYEITVSIIDQSGDTLWRGKGEDKAPRTVKFKVKPAVYQLDFAERTIAAAQGSNTTVTIYPPSAYPGDVVNVTIGAKVGGNAIPLAQNLNFGSANESGVYQAELGTSKLPEGDYELTVAGDNPNYEVNLPSGGITLSVVKPSSTPSVIWVLRNGKEQKASQTTSSNSYTFPNAIPYDGQVYYVTATSKNIAFSIDRTYNSDGFKNGMKTVRLLDGGADGEAAQAINVGKYKTTVRLKSTSTAGLTFDYSVIFEIERAKIDMSKVKWQNDGRMTFTGSPQTCDLEGLPEGVEAIYGGAKSGTYAGDRGNKTVEFRLSEEAKNYYLPEQGNPDSYKDDGGSFKWSIDWEILPLTLPLEWKLEGKRDDSGSLYNAYVLKNDGEYIKYYYYETDSSGNISEGAERLEKITVPKDKIRYYKALATISPSGQGNYVLAETEEEKCFSNFFEVGRPITEVQVAASKTEYLYWGSPVDFRFYVSKGSVNTSYFEIVYWNGYTQLSGAPTNAGDYRAVIGLKREHRNTYSLQGDTSFDFRILRAEIAIDWNDSKPPVLTLNTAEAKAIEYEYVDSNNNPVMFGDLQKDNNYAVRAVVTDTQNYVFKGDTITTEWKNFTIASTDTIINPTDPSNPFKPGEPKDPNADTRSKTPVTIELASYSAAFNGGSQSVTVRDKNGLGWTNDDFVIEYYAEDGSKIVAPSAAGIYSVKVSLAGVHLNDYVLSGTDTFIFRIEGTGTPGPIDPGNTGDNPSGGTLMQYLPIILSGVSLFLIVVFTIMTFNYNAAAKAAKEKARKLAQITYSFAPAGLLALMFGLSESNWWIIAGALMGLALVMAIVAFTFKGKKKRALQMLEEEQERVAEEKEMARIEREEAAREQDRREMREEQERRENEMRMMFAAMQQGGYGQAAPFAYEDMQNMISSAISALLPAMQQQMALPPASSDGAYGANPEADALRAQLAAQEERMARQQEQMAQQQELLNQILQNQQSAQYYEEEIEDDISWLGESDEAVSLEESYGALGDEGKRAYYDIGSYIMNKPRVSQNDGRYAVLFKYRGRTILKLCIRDDMPVLYYPAGRGRGEVCVSDASSLQAARSVIDQVVSAVDNELN